MSNQRNTLSRHQEPPSKLELELARNARKGVAYDADIPYLRHPSIAGEALTPEIVADIHDESDNMKLEAVTGFREWPAYDKDPAGFAENVSGYLDRAIDSVNGEWDDGLDGVNQKARACVDGPGTLCKRLEPYAHDDAYHLYSEDTFPLMLVAIGRCTDAECEAAIFDCVDRKDPHDAYDFGFLRLVLTFTIDDEDASRRCFRSGFGPLESTDDVEADWQYKRKLLEPARAFIHAIRAGTFDAIRWVPRCPPHEDLYEMQGDASELALAPLVDPSQLSLPLQGGSGHVTRKPILKVVKPRD